MKKINLICGLPGTGKSTLSEKILIEYPDSFVYSTDAEIERRCKFNQITYDLGFETFIAPATKHMNEQLDIAIRSNRDVIWDQTNLSIKKRKGIISRFSQGWFIACHVILPPDTDQQQVEWADRLVGRPGKNIPVQVINNMKAQYQIPISFESANSMTYYDMYGNIISRL